MLAAAAVVGSLAREPHALAARFGGTRVATSRLISKATSAWSALDTGDVVPDPTAPGHGASSPFTAVAVVAHTEHGVVTLSMRATPGSRRARGVRGAAVRAVIPAADARVRHRLRGRGGRHDRRRRGRVWPARACPGPARHIGSASTAAPSGPHWAPRPARSPYSTRGTRGDRVSSGRSRRHSSPMTSSSRRTGARLGHVRRRAADRPLSPERQPVAGARAGSLRSTSRSRGRRSSSLAATTARCVVTASTASSPRSARPGRLLQRHLRLSALVVTPSSVDGTVSVLDRNGRSARFGRVARAAHDACILGT